MYLYMTGNTLYICRICICLISSFCQFYLFIYTHDCILREISRAAGTAKIHPPVPALPSRLGQVVPAFNDILYNFSPMYLLYTHLLYIYPYCYLLYTILSISDVSPLQEQELSVSFLIQHREDMHSYPQAAHQMLCCTVPVHSLPRI